jgi:CheY-like chemotaxis protein
LSAPLVLVVDDEALVRMNLADCLTYGGFDVLEAEDADQALDVLDSNPSVAALITDVRMPGSRDGFELAREVAASKSHIRIFVMSGYVGGADTRLPAGAVFLSKPFGQQALMKSLTAALANSA